MSDKICQYCQLDTAGNHQFGCPNSPNMAVSTGFMPDVSDCLSCTRLKALCEELWKLRKDLSTGEIDEYDFLEETLKLESRLKEEGILK